MEKFRSRQISPRLTFQNCLSILPPMAPEKLRVFEFKNGVPVTIPSGGEKDPHGISFVSSEDDIPEAWRGEMRFHRYDPEGNILANIWVKNSEGNSIGSIEENPQKTAEQKGLWGLWFKSGINQEGPIYCYPHLIDSLENAKLAANALIGKTIKELKILDPEDATWAR
jgi:hypothetical protein